MNASVVHLPDDLRIGLRQMVTDDPEYTDEGYILRSWQETLKQAPANAWARNGDGAKALAYALKLQCEKLLRRYGAVVACDPAHPTFVLGWAVMDRPKNVLHYVYVLKDFRGNGIAKALLAGLSEPIVATNWSRDCEWLQEHVRFKYQPSLL